MQVSLNWLWHNSSLLCFRKANDESREQNKEYEETKKQIEEDSDREILDIKNNYEIQLRREREENIKLKGETGIMKKKVRNIFKKILNILIMLDLTMALSRFCYIVVEDWTETSWNSIICSNTLYSSW